jgi:DNA-directed RNA polymerase
MDFRGRLYYKGAHLNPQMGDDVKVVLTLANKKPLGTNGLHWLCWGVASAAGYDKAAFGARVTYTREHLQEIRKAVEDPSTSDYFINTVMKDGEPALFLQRANELINAIDSGDSASYETDVTIAMDATCSGLQILSAVAKDRQGGSLVNITETPETQTEKADVYGTVAKLILKKYSQLPENYFAQWVILNGIPRRFTKRPVMTLPYSATIRSAIGYVQTELQGNSEKGIAPYPLPASEEDRRELQLSIKSLMGKEESGEVKLDDNSLYYGMATLIARDIHGVCRETIPAAMTLLEFFKSTPKKLYDHAIWNTPDGLYVKQRYGVEEESRTKYTLTWVDQDTGEICQKLIQRRYAYIDPSDRDRSKASNGMPPNWVHSLDGTLVRRVMLSAPFEIIAIHDSFAAHPADCDDLARILREQFVWIVEQEPLQRLIDQLNAQVGEEVFKSEPLMLNTWNPKEALNSEFLFC